MATDDREKALETALAQIDKQYGKGSVMRLGDEVRAPIEVIPSGSIALDLALGIGGLPRGRVVEIYGPESSGKTTVALHAIANAQAAGGICAFIDAEHALDPDYAARLGVDTDALLVSQPDNGEQALEIADMLVRSGALALIVIDSVAALTPRAEIEGEMGDSHVGLQARLMSQALRKMTGALSGANTTAIFINQLREKIGVMFGCFSYGTRVQLADGTTQKIGSIVNQKRPVEVMSYDPATDSIIPRKVINWFDNGNADHFLQFTVARSGRNGRAQFAATPNHLVRTPGGWREAGEAVVDAAVREVREETGLAVAADDLEVCAYERFTVDGEVRGRWLPGRSFLQVYRTRVAGSAPLMAASEDDVDGWHWVDRAEFERLCGGDFWWPLVPRLFD